MQNNLFLFFAARPILMVIFIAIIIAAIILKGLALWRAARNSQKGWFVALLVINILGLLEIIYLLGFSKPQPTSAGDQTPVKH